MKRNLLLVLALFTAVCLGANAELTPAQQTDAEYLINNGYSEASAEQVLIMKNRAAGAPCEPLFEEKHNGFVRFLHDVYSYLDPTIDNEERYHHDIKMSPKPSDL